MTLKDFKAAIDREGTHRYHFKALDPEFGTVKEEVCLACRWDSLHRTRGRQGGFGCGQSHAWLLDVSFCPFLRSPQMMMYVICGL